jgi:hypothetical protein
MHAAGLTQASGWHVCCRAPLIWSIHGHGCSSLATLAAVLMQGKIATSQARTGGELEKARRRRRSVAAAWHDDSVSGSV